MPISGIFLLITDVNVHWMDWTSLSMWKHWIGCMTLITKKRN